MQINNFKQIERLLKFENPYDFYTIEIIKRRKDNLPNEEFVQSSKKLKFYSVESLEQYISTEKEIIEICEANNARAYIRLNRRNKKKIIVQLLKALATYIADENYNYNYKKLYESICGKFHSDKEPTWIVDVDTKDGDYVTELVNFIKESYNYYYFLETIETVNGYHFICSPFHNREFRSRFRDIELHKDNPTLLFFKGM